MGFRGQPSSSFIKILCGLEGPPILRNSHAGLGSLCIVCTRNPGGPFVACQGFLGVVKTVHDFDHPSFGVNPFGEFRGFRWGVLVGLVF